MKYKITLKGRTYEVEVERGEAMILDEYEALSPVPSAPAPAPVPAPAAPAAPAPVQAPAGGGTPVVSPLPGNVLAVNVKVGDRVKAGQVLVLVEAMKMENEIAAPADGTVKQLCVSKGAVVATGDTLLVI